MQEVRVNIRGVINLRIEELNAFQEDIKVLTEENYQQFKLEILEDGFSFSPHVFLDSDAKAWILDGHQRRTTLARMKEEGYSIPTIPCMEVEAESIEHARRLVMAAASQYGTFQVKKVVNFVNKMGITPQAAVSRFCLPTIKFEKAVNVNGYQRSSSSGVEYTKKIQSPIYEPKGEKPEIGDLVDLKKMEELQTEIALAEGLDAGLKEFLRLASYRHTVFNYEKIAEYYAHAPKNVQELMEKSALVIIDFNKAIENGFVTMTKEIAEAYPDEE